MVGRIGLGSAGKFASGGDALFFTLADDGDSAEVSFLYDNPDGTDIDYYLTHQVKIDGRDRNVVCRAVSEDGETLHEENCPLCSAGKPRIEKMYLQVYNWQNDRVEVWDRGRSFVPKIQSLINSYGSLCSTVFNVVRNGARGDSYTTYDIIEQEVTGNTLADFPEKSDVVGTYVLELTPEQIEQFNSTGEVKTSQPGNGVQGRRRTPGGGAGDNTNMAPRRRTGGPSGPRF